MKISIIGAGNVGGLTAIQLENLHLGEIVLLDTMSNIVSAKAMDLNDARFIFKNNYQIKGTDDVNKISNSDIIIITAGLARKPGMSREELVEKNSEIIRGICRNIKRICSNPIIIVVTNPLDAITYLVLKETSLSSSRVFGMGLTLDSSRLANLISEAIDVSVSEIEPCIIGSHGKEMLPLGRHTKVKGLPLDNYLNPEEIKQLFDKTVQRGAQIVSFLGSGSAYFAPSAAIVELIKSVVLDQKRVLPVSVSVDGHYGLKDICIGLPCCIGREGVESIIELELNEEEKADLIKSAESIKKQINSILCLT